MVRVKKRRCVEPMAIEEARATFESKAQFYLGISGEEFLRRYDAGEYDDPDDHPGMMAVAMAIPLVRPEGPYWRDRSVRQESDMVRAEKRRYVEPMTPEESWTMFDAEAHCYLGIGGKEFLRRYDAGEYDDPDDHPGVMAVAMLIPGIRPGPL